MQQPEFEPVAVAARTRAPSRSVNPDAALGWIRRLAPLLVRYRWRFAAYVFGALVAMLGRVVEPAIIRVAVDDGLVSQKSSLAPYVVVLVVLAVARGLITYFYRFGLFRLAFDLDTDLRILLYQRFLTHDWPYYDRVSSGQLVSRANSDIRSVQMFLTFSPLMLLTLVQFAVAVAYMASISLRLTLVAVAALPGVYLLGTRLRNQAFPLSWISQGRVADVATVVDENIAGVRVVRSFAAERRQLRQLARAATALRWANVRAVDARARYNPVIENLPRLGMAGVLAYGGTLAIRGQVTTGTLFAFTAYVTQLQAPFRSLGMFLMLQQRAAASAQRIYQVLDEQPTVQDRPGAIDLVDCRGDICFDDVCFAYADSPPLLNGFSLTIKAGETVALVGRTGCGKSTVARLLGRFYDVDDGGSVSGSVSVDGHDVRNLTQVSLRHHLGFVFDEPFLFSLPLADNIAYARPDAELPAVAAAARDAQAEEFISNLPEIGRAHV